MQTLRCLHALRFQFPPTVPHGGVCPSNLHGGKGEAKCECKRFDDCDHFDFSFRMRYTKPTVTVNANAPTIATERRRPNMNTRSDITGKRSSSSRVLRCKRLAETGTRGSAGPLMVIGYNVCRQISTTTRRKTFGLRADAQTNMSTGIYACRKPTFFVVEHTSTYLPNFHYCFPGGGW